MVVDWLPAFPLLLRIADVRKAGEAYSEFTEPSTPLIGKDGGEYQLCCTCDVMALASGAAWRALAQPDFALRAARPGLRQRRAWMS